ncbi:MAG TPA: YetF domain-containing protein [Reyranella sp.]|nr:YetF domain-containing protein [Reyranella sp.]
MDWLWKVDWVGIVEPKHALLELFLRGSIMYLVIIVLLRVVVRRTVGGIGMTDILVIVLIAEVAGNGIADSFQSVVESTVLVFTVLFWSYVLEWLQSHFPAMERLLRDRKLKLVEDGRMLRRNMRSEFVTADELMAQLREHGLEDCSKVKAAYMEADGKISIIRRDGS